MQMQFETIQKLGQDNADATLKALGAVSQGVQAIAVEAGDFMKKSFEQSTATFEKLAGVRSLDKAVEIQTEYLKTAYEGLVAQSTKVGQLYAGVANDAFRPYQGIVAKSGTAL